MDGQLLTFQVTNHRSLRGEQELSFVASASGKEDPRLLHPEGLNEQVLPVCAMYGANASGKSNVMEALAFMQQAVVLSQRLWEPTEGVPIDPFALSDEPSRRSTFVVDIVLGGVRYEYGFSADEQQIQEEWLYAWPVGRKQEWFSREGQQFTFNRSLHGENKAIETLTRSNSLFLSAAAQNNHEQLTPLFEWFATRLRISANTALPALRRHAPWWKQVASEAAGNDAERLRTQIRVLLRAADLGIVDFRVNDELPTSDGEEGSFPAHKVRRQRLSFAHRTGDRAAWLDLEEESTGTQALVGLLPTLLPLLDRGGVLAIDELNSLHPMLTLALVQIFQDPERNPRGAQLLFNTHDSSLLGNLLADPAPLRRDQIWLIEKDNEGASHLYPLTDYTPRAAENLERGYLQGRYGAVPFLGSFDWNEPAKADE
jgi:AAA15 family ATPase/GTPase